VNLVEQHLEDVELDLAGEQPTSAQRFNTGSRTYADQFAGWTLVLGIDLTSDECDELGSTCGTLEITALTETAYVCNQPFTL
jgi:hypothetical protein